LSREAISQYVPKMIEVAGRIARGWQPGQQLRLLLQGIRGGRHEFQALPRGEPGVLVRVWAFRVLDPARG